jgi:hypothetical protein
MFYPEDIERQILHNSTNGIKYSDKPLIKSYNNNNNISNPIIHKAERKIGGSEYGVSTLKPAKLLQSSSMSGGCDTSKPCKKQPSAWQTIIKNTMKEKGLTMKEAIKYIKSNNLY